MLCLNGRIYGFAFKRREDFKPQFQEILAEAQDATKYQLLGERNTCVLLNPDFRGDDKCFRNNATPFSALRAVYNGQKGSKPGQQEAKAKITGTAMPY